MSFWGSLGHWLNFVVGGGERQTEVDPSHVDQAIQLIQNAVDEEQRDRQTRKLKVSDLNQDRQEQLAIELQRLLGKPATK